MEFSSFDCISMWEQAVPTTVLGENIGEKKSIFRDGVQQPYLECLLYIKYLSKAISKEVGTIDV